MQNIEWSLLLPAFVTGLLVLLTHVPLGHEVLRRGIIFLDLSIAQIAALGALAALSMGYAPNTWVTEICSFSAAMLGAFFLDWTEKRWQHYQEAIIGILFILSATGALLLLAHNGRGSEEMKDILAGQILWVNYAQLSKGALIFGCVTPILYSRLIEKRLAFYLVFSLCVMLSVRWIGVYLVFSSLVIPALSTRTLTRPASWLHAYLIGCIGYGSGLILSAWLDLPSGPLIVWMLTFTALVWRVSLTLLSSSKSSVTRTLTTEELP